MIWTTAETTIRTTTRTTIRTTARTTIRTTAAATIIRTAAATAVRTTTRDKQFGRKAALWTWGGFLHILIVKRGQVRVMMYPTITMRDLDNWISYGQTMYLVDLRNQASFDKCHLTGAVNIPFEELEEHVEEFPVDRPIVFYCSRGSQSMLACNQLCGRGFQVINAGGGMTAYRGRNLVCTVPQR